MKHMVRTGMVMAFILISACSGKNLASTVPGSEEEVQESVQNFYNQMSEFEQLGKSSLAAFNEALTSYSTGQATDKQLEKAVTKFQNAAAEIADKAEDVKVSSALPENIGKLLSEAKIAFESAYEIKEEASKSAVSPEVTAEQFEEMNQKADVAMLYGISKLNEARVASGLLEPEDGVQNLQQ
ncbi:hypothetical protein J7E73_30985 [Paenibacillus albidus]|uniref:hypothetical protein n=1 Tax=Paenibacillus albidus TaxID=2041023 RepID=UPI001BECE79B|nr:hypothetical protein [Paenibacillus albidus]MBT2293441.1 hypothetical protein [Paenibacillus albidus]